MNLQTQYICCHRIIPDCSDYTQQVITIQRSVDFMIKPMLTKQGDKFLNHEWYIVEVKLSYYGSLNTFSADTSFNLNWTQPIATLKSTDSCVTWNKSHPLYESLVLHPQLSTTI